MGTGVWGTRGNQLASCASGASGGASGDAWGCVWGVPRGAARVAWGAQKSVRGYALVSEPLLTPSESIFYYFGRMLVNFPSFLVYFFYLLSIEEARHIFVHYMYPDYI